VVAPVIAFFSPLLVHLDCHFHSIVSSSKACAEIWRCKVLFFLSSIAQVSETSWKWDEASFKAGHETGGKGCWRNST
jgi:hypothetical protein